MPQQIYDLTLTAYCGMRGVEIHTHTTFDQDGYNTTNLHLYSHAGTHMDAPLHFLNGARTIDHVDLTKCVGPALVVDLSFKEPDSLITVADMGASINAIEPGSRVLLRTDWDAHADLADYRTSFPRISRELARWLVDRGVIMVGVQTPSVASLNDRRELTDVHQTLLAAEIVIVESLANLRSLPTHVYFIALPLKIDGGDGSPVRAVAVVD